MFKEAWSIDQEGGHGLVTIRPVMGTALLKKEAAEDMQGAVILIESMINASDAIVWGQRL